MGYTLELREKSGRKLYVDKLKIWVFTGAKRKSIPDHKREDSQLGYSLEQREESGR